MDRTAPVSYVRPSKITVPRQAHPLAKLTFELVRRHGKTYDAIEHEAGILRLTLKAWRGGGELRPNVPSLAFIEAALGTFGWRLVPCPPLNDVTTDVMEQLEEMGQHFVSDDETLAAAIVAATTKPGVRCTADGQRLA